MPATAPWETEASVPARRRTTRAPSPSAAQGPQRLLAALRLWPSSVPLGRHCASSWPGSSRQSSAHVAAMSGPVAVAASSRHQQRVRHATACRTLKAQHKFTNVRATCLSLVWWRWWWCGHDVRRMCLSIHANACNELG